MMDVDNAEVQQNIILIAEHNKNQVNQTRYGSGVGIVLKSLKGTVIEQAVRLGFAASDNESKYEELIIGLKNE